MILVKYAFRKKYWIHPEDWPMKNLKLWKPIVRLEHPWSGTCILGKIIHWCIPHGKSVDGIMKDGMEMGIWMAWKEKKYQSLHRWYQLSMFMTHLQVKDVIRKHLIMIRQSRWSWTGNADSLIRSFSSVWKNWAFSFQKCSAKRWIVINIIMRRRDFRMKYLVKNLCRTKTIRRMSLKLCRKR